MGWAKKEKKEPVVNAEFPKKLEPLFIPNRYKVLYGGRGGAKSWGVARALLVLGSQNPLRILCARELQNSIKDSVHQLLSDQIKSLGLSGVYEVFKSEIRGVNGTKFSFCGLRHNATEIKSHEGADICWVEEAQMVTKSSWEILIPTIRKEASEIWLTFNPVLEEDETYQRFVINPPPGAFVIKLNWEDNPWFPDVLARERDDLKVRDPDAYLNVWEGHCRQNLEGAIYAEQLRLAQEDGRITNVPVDKLKPVNVYWDLGWADHTSMWFEQTIGMEVRIIDYFQDQLKPLSYYLGILQQKGYIYNTMYLPHDAKAKSLGTGKSIEEMIRSNGFSVQLVPKLSVEDGINATREFFNKCWFDEKRCSDGLHSLRHYRYEVNPDTRKISAKPLHDWASHGADAFRYLAVATKRKPRRRGIAPQIGNWLGL